MIEFNQPFTDQHGVTHLAPVFVVTAINSNNGAYEYKNFDTETHEYGGNVRAHHTVYYEVIFWTSLEAMENGRRPIQLILENGEQGFNIEPDVESVTPLVQMCESHFTSTFLDLLDD